MSESKKYKYRIQGVHCQSCELLIEEKLRHLPNIERVHVNHATRKILFKAFEPPNIEEINQQLLQADGYRIIPLHDPNAVEDLNITVDDKGTETIVQNPGKKRHYLEIGAVLIIVLAAYMLLKQFDLLPQGFGISQNVSLGFAFAIGLVAAFSSCIAVTGGLLLGVAEKYNEKNPHLTGFQRFKPHLYFNLGRLLSYGILGGLVGLLGSALNFSPKVMGIITIIASLVMILLGLNMLKIFPWLQRFNLRMPKFFGRKAHDMSRSEGKTAPFVMGGLTFFLPCGFTQALQLYVLSKGDFLDGASIMFFFALGTLPALISLGALSSFAKGTFHRYFIKFAGVTVIILGIFNVSNGYNLSGLAKAVEDSGETEEALDKTALPDPNVKIVDGKQVVEMYVEGYSYSPSRFTVKKDMPVQWKIYGNNAAGCAQVVIVPNLEMGILLDQPTKVVEFTPEETGEIPFSCSMGMTTPGAAFVVVEA